MTLAEDETQTFLASVADAVMALNPALAPMVGKGRDGQAAVVLRCRFTAHVIGTAWVEKDRLWLLREPMIGSEAQFEAFTRPDFNPERGDKVSGLNNIALGATIVMGSMDDCARVLSAARIAPDAFGAAEVDFALASLRRSIDVMTRIGDGVIAASQVRRPAADAARSGSIALERFESGR